MSSSLSELADAYGITKITAKNRLVSLGLFDGHVVKEGRAFVIDDYAVEEFGNHFEKGGAKRGRPAGSKNIARPEAIPAAPEELIAELRETVEFLKEQLAQKDDLCSKQLAEKDEQIARRDDQISQLIAK